VALIKKDILNANPLFFAIPAESMNFQIKNH